MLGIFYMVDINCDIVLQLLLKFKDVLNHVALTDIKFRVF